MSSYSLSWSQPNAWGDRFRLDVTIANTGNQVLESATFDLWLDGSIAKLWGADWTRLDAGLFRVTVNERIAPGETLTIGLTANGDPAVDPALTPVLADGMPVSSNPIEGEALEADTGSDPVADTADTPALSIEHAQRKSWSDGFTHDVTVTNDGEGSVDTVQVRLTLDGTIEKIWGGTYEPAGDGTWIVTLSTDGLAPGETASFGFTAEADPTTTVAVSPIEMVESDPESPSDPVNGTSGPASAEETPTDGGQDGGPVSGPDAIVVDVALGTSAAELQAMIDSAAPGTVLQLQAGTYHFDRTVVLDGDGVSVLGAGSGETIIDVASDLGSEAFSVGDGGRSGSMTLAQDAALGTTELLLEAGHSFVAGDHVYLSRANTDAFFDEIGDTAWMKDAPLRTSIVEVVAVDGNRIELASGVHFDFVTGETTVQEIVLVEDVRLGGFTVDYGLGRADPSDFSNTLAQYDRDAVIQVEGTTRLEIEDVVARDIPSLGINVALSADILVEGVEMTGAHNKGSGGNGYALQLRDVYDSAFVGLTDMDMRHSVVFASWRSAVGNDVHVYATDRDINFHGGRDHGNSVWVDHSIRDAESDVIAPTYFINDEGRSYGAPTDPDANSTVFGHVVGTRLGDEVTGKDGGSWLDGAGGHDTLVGGNGADVLIGGTGSDVLTGGAGPDIALYRGTSDDFIFLTLSDGAIEVEDRNGTDGDEGTDLLYEVDWIAFHDAALNVAEGSWHAVDAVDGVFKGVKSIAPGEIVDADTRAALDAWAEGGNTLLPDAGQEWTVDLLYQAAAINDLSGFF